MGEQNVIELTKNMNTVDSIYSELMKLGIRNNDILLVHSSLSSLGWVCGGAQSVIMALLKVIKDGGTLVMPAQSGDWSDPAQWQKPPVPKDWIEKIYKHMPAFDVNLTPTRGMGIIAELFRTLPDTLRSSHPQVSFSANGKYAREITEKHILTPQFGLDTPLGTMYKLNAKVLLLGADYDCCTSFHLAEALSERLSKKKVGTAMMEEGKRVWKWFEDFEYDSDKDFIDIGKAFEETGKITKGKVGNADCRLFSMKEAVDFALEWIRKNR